MTSESLSMGSILEGYKARIGKVFITTGTGLWAYEHIGPAGAGDGALLVGESFIPCEVESWVSYIQMKILVGSRIRYILVDQSHFRDGPECVYFREMV